MNHTHEIILEQVIEKIEEFNTIIIHRHVNPDPDALGSQGGLQYIIQESFPNKRVYVVGEEVEGLTFLNKMDEISDEVYEDALVIVCDTANTERISDKRYNLGKYLIKIDHHPNKTPYGDLEWVDTSFSSTSEMITALFIKDYTISNQAARLLYAGIIGDTGRFLYSNTSSRTLYFASELSNHQFNPQEIYESLYKTTRETAKLQGYILQNFNVTEHGVASLYISKQLLSDFNVLPVEAANLVNVLSNIEGNNVWVFFIEYDDEIRVRIRSKKEEIHTIAHQFNGGGHPLASGATVQTMAEGEQLLTALDNLLETK